MRLPVPSFKTLLPQLIAEEAERLIADGALDRRVAEKIQLPWTCDRSMLHLCRRQLARARKAVKRAQEAGHTLTHGELFQALLPAAHTYYEAAIAKVGPGHEALRCLYFDPTAFFPKPPPSVEMYNLQVEDVLCDQALWPLAEETTAMGVPAAPAATEKLQPMQAVHHLLMECELASYTDGELAAVMEAIAAHEDGLWLSSLITHGLPPPWSATPGLLHRLLRGGAKQKVIHLCANDIRIENFRGYLPVHTAIDAFSGEKGG